MPEDSFTVEAKESHTLFHNFSCRYSVSNGGALEGIKIAGRERKRVQPRGRSQWLGSCKPKLHKANERRSIFQAPET